MGNKITCSTCLNQTEGVCEIKKVTVKLKKRRKCDNYRQDTNKIKFKEEIPVTKRPDWFWNREEKRKHMKDMLERLSSGKFKRSQDGMEMINVKHPLTGDLSRFKTTAGTEKNKKETE